MVIIIVSLGIAGVICYGYGTADERAVAPVEGPSDAPNTDTMQQPLPKAPKVFERDVQSVLPDMWLVGEPELQEEHVLRFHVDATNWTAPLWLDRKG